MKPISRPRVNFGYYVPLVKHDWNIFKICSGKIWGIQKSLPTFVYRAKSQRKKSEFFSGACKNIVFQIMLNVNNFIWFNSIANKKSLLFKLKYEH